MMLSAASLARWTSSRFLGPVTLGLAVLVISINEVGYQAVDRLAVKNAMILDARMVSEKVRRLALMMESAKRGYILTGREAYLQPYHEMRLHFEPLLDEVLAVAQQYPEQRDKLQDLAEAARRKNSEMIEVLSRFQSGNAEGALELTLTEIGRENMERIQQIAEAIQREEAEAFAEVSRRRDELRQWSRFAITGLVLLCVGAIFAVLRLSREREQERQRHLVQLGAERDSLEQQVELRTRELTDLAQHLQRVREDERGRLARDLHDELGGLLTAAKLDVARVKKRIDAGAEELVERIAHLSQTLDAGIALKRRIIEDLRPSSLAHLGLQRTLEIQCSEFAQRSELQVVAEIDTVPLDPECALAVYRVVQEALTNIAKYAQARQVRVSLRREGERARLLVEDDGRGFDPARLPPSSHGLAGMRFRLRSCGGALSLQAAPGRGTVIDALLPLAASDAAVLQAE